MKCVEGGREGSIGTCFHAFSSLLIQRRTPKLDRMKEDFPLQSEPNHNKELGTQEAPLRLGCVCKSHLCVCGED